MTSSSGCAFRGRRRGFSSAQRTAGLTPVARQGRSWFTSSGFRQQPCRNLRELALSLLQLEQLGFLEKGRPETPQYWREREFTPNLKEIDDFCETLRILPIIAMVPNQRYPGAAQMAEQGKLVAWVREMSQNELRMMADMFSAVRRHPFHGYQWTVSTGPVYEHS